MSRLKHTTTYYRRGQIWEAGFDGMYNTEDAVDAVTGKVGQQQHVPAESRTLQIQRQREREAFDRIVVSRAEQFKHAFSKLDLDGTHAHTHTGSCIYISYTHTVCKTSSLMRYVCACMHLFVHIYR